MSFKAVYVPTPDTRVNAHTHTATNRNTLSNKQNPYSLKNKKDSPLPPALLF